MDITSADFLAILESHKRLIYKIANSYCKDPDDRKDLVQEIVIQLWRSIENYNGRFQYSTWIYRIALNTAISFYRKESRRVDLSNPLSDEILTIANPIGDAEVEEKLGLLQRFISELKDIDKALMLLYLEEKSYREISEILGISESNVATKINRIKILLKDRFLHFNLN